MLGIEDYILRSDPQVRPVQNDIVEARFELES